MLSSFIEKLIRYENLTEFEAYQLISMIMDGQLSNPQIAGILTALLMKGETPDEICGFSRGMKERAIKVKRNGEKIIDVCGTGADNSNSYNISTLTAFVLAGAGLKVVKHGNRSISSKCGSADIIRALGIAIELNPEQVIKSLHETNFAFLFAPTFHPAMKMVAPVRKELAIKTIFNILGPLTNPADPDYQLVGVYDESKARKIAAFFLKQNKRAFIIHSKNGWDEATPVCPFILIEVTGEEIIEEVIEPQRIGFKKYRESDLQGATMEENCCAALEALSGKEGPLKDTIILNAALAFLLVRKATDIIEAVAIARSTIEQGNAITVINKLRTLFPFNN
ncbi:MAG: anthranilate phosphoribosyltransferase [Candidatus Fischerbacteria bacterium RBG_13_37_8]|uniref:Anthranilate phosphoribosyltransferase n=1 Tax=Candidatus Fischerbacteria bacterium RBG_13_37_8 TaxID=1817863 RepID=A0A1F5VD65_9BACT|nr:MAG: anthranilate phosphoribosyltransferase [Candidatus Fischerbacteria bacterium RBG_13_37_8]